MARKDAGRLPVTVTTESGARRVRPSARALAGLVSRIGGAGDRCLVLTRIPDVPDDYLQVWHEAGGGYDLEYRDGDPGRHYEVSLPAAGQVVAAMTSWAARAPAWDASLAWQHLHLPAAIPPPPDLPAGQRADLEARLRLALAAGYSGRADLAELAEEYLATSDSRPVSREQAAALADRLWTERAREQEQWEGDTDPDRLTRAFAALDAGGVVAREAFACCHACGMAEIGGQAPPGSRGFVFSDSQAADAAAAGHGLTLYYGGFDGSADTTAAVGREVVAALAAAGLRTQWDSSPASAIEVTPLDWRKRLPA